jgi:hypothetical protein
VSEQTRARLTRAWVDAVKRLRRDGEETASRTCPLSVFTRALRIAGACSDSSQGFRWNMRRRRIRNGKNKNDDQRQRDAIIGLVETEKIVVDLQCYV